MTCNNPTEVLYTSQGLISVKLTIVATYRGVAIVGSGVIVIVIILTKSGVVSSSYVIITSGGAGCTIKSGAETQHQWTFWQ